MEADPFSMVHRAKCWKGGALSMEAEAFCCDREPLSRIAGALSKTYSVSFPFLRSGQSHRHGIPLSVAFTLRFV
jgi:hypothetical protein